MAIPTIAQIVINDNIFLCLKALLDPYLEEQGGSGRAFFLCHKQR